jgi:hypothetical protein
LDTEGTFINYLEQIAGNARTLVDREFTHEAAVERYRRILENLRQRD